MNWLRRIITGFMSSIYSSFRIIAGERKIYSIVFTGLIALSCGNEDLIKKIEDYNTPPPEPYYFNVIITDPGTDSINITLNADINVEFDDNIDISSVTAATFFISPDPGTGVFTYDAQTKTVTFNPDSDLSPYTLYTVTLTTGIKNIAGETMFSDYTWSFTSMTGAAPEISVSSPLFQVFTGDTYDFGTKQDGSTTPVSFTVTDCGAGPLDLNSLVVSGANSDQFTVSLDPSPVTINPGLNATLTIDFVPAGTGIKNAVLTIINTDPDENPFILNLTGNSVPVGEPEIQITYHNTILVSSVTVINFGTVTIGSSGSIELVMSNIGSDFLNISGYTISGNDPGFFSTDYPITDVIAPGATRSFNIIFTPGAKGNKKADVTFMNNDSDESSFTVSVKGRGK